MKKTLYTKIFTVAEATKAEFKRMLAANRGNIEDTLQDLALSDTNWNTYGDFETEAEAEASANTNASLDFFSNSGVQFIRFGITCIMSGLADIDTENGEIESYDDFNFNGFAEIDNGTIEKVVEWLN